MESSMDAKTLSAHQLPKAMKYKPEIEVGLKQPHLEYAGVINCLSIGTCDIQTQMLNLSELGLIGYGPGMYV
tara:strand:+ start:590 stop:805 length:216 start_codon:yes stop_codon:yes gene_type:complete